MLFYLFLHEYICFGYSLELSQLSNTNPLHRLQCVSNEQHIRCLVVILMPNHGIYVGGDSNAQPHHRLKGDLYCMKSAT